jgi:hypothetical protein
MPQSVSYIIERIPFFFFVQHSVCKTVAQGMRSDIVRVAATAIDLPRPSSSNIGNIVQDVPDPLFSDPICLSGQEQCSGISLPAIQVCVECASGIRIQVHCYADGEFSFG